MCVFAVNRVMLARGVRFDSIPGYLLLVIALKLYKHTYAYSNSRHYIVRYPTPARSCCVSHRCIVSGTLLPTLLLTSTHSVRASSCITASIHRAIWRATIVLIRITGGNMLVPHAKRGPKKRLGNIRDNEGASGSEYYRGSSNAMYTPPRNEEAIVVRTMLAAHGKLCTARSCSAGVTFVL